VAFGHSHLGGLSDALELLEATKSSFAQSATIQLWGNYDPHYTVVDGKEVYHPELLRDIFNLIEIQKPDIIAALLFGSEYFALCFPTTHRKFDFLIPGSGQPPSEAGAEIIPYDLVFEMAYQTFRPHFGLMQHIQAVTKIPVAYLLPPPPTSQTAVIQKNLSESLRELTELYYMPSASLIYKSWCIYAAATRELCSEFGIAVVPPPREALDEQGLLRIEYVKDCLHGNAEYGAIVIEQLAQVLRSNPRPRGYDGTSI
jgi:hypothetical protein